MDTGKEDFMKGSHHYKHDAVTGEAESKFDESWPESERPSTIDVALRDLPSPIGSVDGVWSGWGTCAPNPLQSPPEKGNKDGIHKRGQEFGPAKKGSTLAKYIERFRSATPLSREEREKRKMMGREEDFWWLSSQITPSDSSTPKDETIKDSDAGIRSRMASKPDQSSPTLFTKTKSKLTKQNINDLLDCNTKRLQERADKLLEKAESSMNSSEPVVSTVGLGSEDRTSTVGSASVMDEVCYRPNFTRWSDLDQRIDSKIIPESADGDILSRWRQRRRLENARLKPGHRAVDVPHIMNKQDSEIEGKLSEFRRKLAEGINPTTSSVLSAVQSQHLSFTPAPETSKAENKVITKCLAERSIQVNLIPTSLTADACTSPMHSRDTPIPNESPAKEATHVEVQCDIVIDTKPRSPRVAGSINDSSHEKINKQSSDDSSSSPVLRNIPPSSSEESTESDVAEKPSKFRSRPHQKRTQRKPLNVPKCHSSPKTPVKRTIGKTVGEMFPSESFTVITSRDSWDSDVLFDDNGRLSHQQELDEVREESGPSETPREFVTLTEPVVIETATPEIPPTQADIEPPLPQSHPQEPGDQAEEEVNLEEVITQSEEDLDLLLLADEEETEDEIIKDLRSKRDFYVNLLCQLEMKLDLS
ncbi:hypothetical protein CAPTEDRAFT_229064 [Capitella teleta]|uniref:Uncharacterized protein n=1 Tax=Capitella teleta TaxID=283909 RepID=X2B1B5_CAPTE|nr:hypothetical protein CAPTEDRAFT_229064 [Capitella teleta]|eukprot:ELU00291.1 hypothetical protein CAPTEDRAFT_229064 [Capitella teleta]